MSEQELYMMSEEKAKVRSQEGVVRVWRSVWVQNLVLCFGFGSSVGWFLSQTVSARLSVDTRGDLNSVN